MNSLERLVVDEAKKASKAIPDGPQGEVDSPLTRGEPAEAASRGSRKPYEEPQITALELLAVVKGGPAPSATDDFGAGQRP